MSTWVAEGPSNREMADRLIVSLHTVKKHVQNIRSKLGISNRTAAWPAHASLKLL